MNAVLEQEFDRKKVTREIKITPFEERAHFLAERGIPCTPLKIGTKQAFISGWEESATCDLDQIAKWNKDYPENNVGAVAKAKLGGYWFLELDSVDAAERIERETGKRIPETLTVLSSPGHTHFYFRHSALSLARLTNLAQGFVKHNDWSARVDKMYVVAPFSVHPKTGLRYEVLTDADIVEAPVWLIDWLLSQKTTTERAALKPRNERNLIPHGGIHDHLVRQAGKMRHDGHSVDGIENALVDWAHENCELPLDDNHIRQVARSTAGWEQGNPLASAVSIGGKLVMQPLNTNPSTTAALLEVPDENSEAAIPPFDSSVINGIYARFVELITRGTTLQPQFAYVIAKTIVGLKMAGKVKFDTIDIEPRLYAALIGETGSGKGEAYRRARKIIQPDGGLFDAKTRIKIINSADSGAGLKEFFFSPPEGDPVLFFVDEIEDLGNKAQATRNPGILDTLITLADDTSITRSLAKGTKTKSDARLAMIMCGQDGLTYTKALAGRTKLGLWDRFYPEHGCAQETGDMPPIDPVEAMKLLVELNAMDYSGTMTMTPESKSLVETFWKDQPVEVRKKARWKKVLQLDAFMSAFGRGVRIVELPDVEIAIKIFTRQLVIRRICFTTEVPDKVGYYLGLIKRITERMAVQLSRGAPRELVAKTRRDYERETHAHRDNETHIFTRAWQVHEPVWLERVQVKAPNGQTYTKFLPAYEG